MLIPFRSNVIKRLPMIALLLMVLSTYSFGQASQKASPNGKKQSQKAIMDKVGLQIYSLRNELKEDVSETLAKVKAMGFTEIEGGGYYGLSPEAFKALLDKYDLKCVSMHFPYDRYRDDMDNIVKEAKMIGSTYVGCAWIPHDGASFAREDMQKAIQDFNQWGEKLKAQGLQFFYHTHGYEFQPSPEGTLFDWLVTSTKPDQVQFEMDVFWVKHPGQDPLALLRKYPNRFPLMHLKDMKKGEKGDFTGKAPDEINVVLGTGQIDFQALLKEAQKVGVRYYFIEDEHPDAIHQIPQSMQYLKKLK